MQRICGAILGIGGIAMIITGVVFSITFLLIIGIPLFMVGVLVISFQNL